MVDEHRSMSNELSVERVPSGLGELDTRRVEAVTSKFVSCFFDNHRSLRAL